MATTAILGNGLPLSVVLYGVRANVLEIPLIFVIGNAFVYSDVIRIGRLWILSGIPMALLCVLQFSLPNTVLNVAAGGTSFQNPGALDRYRASGTFPTGAGLTIFSSLLLVYSLHRIYYARGKECRLGVVGVAMAIIIYSMAINRAAVVDAAIVLAVFIVAYSYVRDNLRRGVAVGFGLLAILVLLSAVPIVHEGEAVFDARMVEGESSTVHSFQENIVMRAFSNYYLFISELSDAPALGRGVGLGTNAGAYVLHNDYGFLLSEDEWSRIMLESGPYVGSIYIGLRILVCGYIFTAAWKSLASGSIMAIVFFASCFFILTSGQWGPPEISGGTVIAAGLTLAAARLPEFKTMAWGRGHPDGVR